MDVAPTAKRVSCLTPAYCPTEPVSTWVEVPPEHTRGCSNTKAQHGVARNSKIPSEQNTPVQTQRTQRGPSKAAQSYAEDYRRAAHNQMQPATVRQLALEDVHDRNLRESEFQNL